LQSDTAVSDGVVLSNSYTAAISSCRNGCTRIPCKIIKRYAEWNVPGSIATDCCINCCPVIATGIGNGCSMSEIWLAVGVAMDSLEEKETVITLPVFA
jgi:hypothetical protein